MHATSACDAPQLVHERLRDALSALLALHRLRVHLDREERAHGRVEAAVCVAVVRAVEPLAEPCRLGVRDTRECTGRRRRDVLRPAGEDANVEAGVLGAVEDFVAVKTKEDVGRVFASWGCVRAGEPVQRWYDLPTPGA